ncbi:MULTISPECIES: glycoside hydrolase family 68 protein [Paenarthrobacter]|uniref:Putative sucrose hydrolase n=1 Tax=Paenarthrobacter nicotinovorans TaxID=29320 RepID=Q8GAP2_PAENI|nr:MULTISPECIES: glycoside hydrolase family 68 protein [Paenarthrobacter]BCW12986.1 hypothetical protein NtRootA2_42680 [Arthrobacter sp. NtRootA2]BCW17289.1 hypothetical protein NtRootA4_42680 [Arthrobacter sp. NtRootA4]BCW25397.1 hypothetical protein NtRootC7_42640 [Arthrobacter sp. NtRootC7]BCW29599.1 hypothetical protein NtRootC45_41990 [Arthrobacter sp. NtRootC45]BCW33864.1 hypothetical protein NtRootD5_41950 [Arthrobacter sp. NtRootD5]BCW86641.1 hypothetical protein NicSoilE8_43140 [Art
MLAPEDRWIWDFWHVQDHGIHHLYYLQAPKSLGDPELRHRNATIGHATSTNLIDWTEHGTVLRPGGQGTVDATATWTGSVVRGDDGLWRMFYTGSAFLSPDSATNVETIAVAVSSDLHHWAKDDTFALAADSAWYEKLGDSSWPEEAWRDPWVYRDETGLWHMLITARANTGEVMERGVVGHATSQDLRAWTARPPLTGPDEGFAHLEVIQRVSINDQTFMIFSAHETVVAAQRCDRAHATGTWAAVWTDRIELEHARNITGPELYSGRVIAHNGLPVLLGFLLEFSGQGFIGGVSDPVDLEGLLLKSGLLSPQRAG